jgi:hypothetical protein
MMAIPVMHIVNVRVARCALRLGSAKIIGGVGHQKYPRSDITDSTNRGVCLIRIRNPAIKKQLENILEG